LVILKHRLHKDYTYIVHTHSFKADKRNNLVALTNFSVIDPEYLEFCAVVRMAYVIDNLNMTKYLTDHQSDEQKYIDFSKITPVFHQWGVTVSTETEQMSPSNQFYARDIRKGKIMQPRADYHIKINERVSKASSN
jgi:hypothetical protein